MQTKRQKSLEDRFGKISDRLSWLRPALGFKNRAILAKEAGLCVQRYGRFETGEELPQPIDMAGLCDATGVTLDWIFLGKSEGLPPTVKMLLAA